MLSKIYNKLKGEKVLIISFICALFTMFFVKPSKNYLSYIDFRVLCLLLCLMAVVAGFGKCGAFKYLAVRLLKISSKGSLLGVILVMLPFFTSMLITNDVSLITFVPFTIMLLRQIGCEKSIIPILVLQTVGANLGSMATPVGNPQNLFLYSHYLLSAKDFFSVMMPLTLLSLILLILLSLPVLPKELPKLSLEGKITSKRDIIIYSILFFLCLLTVFRILPFKIMTFAVVLIIFFKDRDILKNLDYSLLLTFVCFFIVSGNLGRIPEVQVFLEKLLDKNTLVTSALASQVISNVPAAVLLSSFTSSWKELLEGVNIGGLGTPIASLASLITLKIYLSEKDSDGKKFLTYFLILNILGLILLLSFASIF